MEKPAIIVARELVNYIKKNSDLQLIQPKECEYKNHIGALFTDIILQSGVNYRTVVAPRVKFVLEMYPIAFSVENFFSTILLSLINLIRIIHDKYITLFSASQK